MSRGGDHRRASSHCERPWGWTQTDGLAPLRRPYDAIVRYRRYYTSENPDGSTTVRSFGPLTTGASKLWHSPFATGFVFFIAFLLLDPWSPGSTANLVWALCWGGVGFALHVLRPTWIRGAKRPQSGRSEFLENLEKVWPGAKALFERKDVKDHGSGTRQTVADLPPSQQKP
jgi:hypothetical protein